jgi:chromosome segregation ATPase
MKEILPMKLQGTMAIVSICTALFLGVAHAQVQEPSDAEMHLKAIRIQMDQVNRDEGALSAATASLAQEQAKQDAANTALAARANTLQAAINAYGASVKRQEHNAWKARLESEKANLAVQANSSDSEVAALKEAWTRRYNAQVQNQKDIDALNRKKAELIKDFNRTIDAILKLKNAEVDCSKIPGIGNLDLTTLDGASERAKACLGKGFDTR